MKFGLAFLSVLLACISSTAFADIVEIGPDDLRIFPNEFSPSTYVPTLYEGNLVHRSGHREFAQAWFNYDSDFSGQVVYLQRIHSESAEFIEDPLRLLPPAGAWKSVFWVSTTYNDQLDEYSLVVTGQPKGVEGFFPKGMETYIFRVSPGDHIAPSHSTSLRVSESINSTARLLWNTNAKRYLLAWLDMDYSDTNNGPHFLRARLLDHHAQPLGDVITVASMRRGHGFRLAHTGNQFLLSWMHYSQNSMLPQVLRARKLDALGGTLEPAMDIVDRPLGLFSGAFNMAATGDTFAFAWMEKTAKGWMNRAAVTDGLGVVMRDFDLTPDRPSSEPDGFTWVIGSPVVEWIPHAGQFMFAWSDTKRGGETWQDYERHLMLQRYTSEGVAEDVPESVSQPWYEGRRKASVWHPSLASDPERGNILATWLDWSYSGAIAGQLVHDTEFTLPPSEPVCEPGEPPVPDEFITGLWTYIEPMCDGSGVRVMISSVRDSLHDVSLSAVASGDSVGKLEFEYTGCDSGSSICELDDFQPEEVRWVNIRVHMSDEQAPSSFQVNISALTGSGFQQNVGQAVTLPALVDVDDSETGVVDVTEADGERVPEIVSSAQDDTIDSESASAHEPQPEEAVGAESENTGEPIPVESAGPASSSVGGTPQTAQSPAAADSAEAPDAGGGAFGTHWLLLFGLAAYAGRRRRPA